MMIILAFTVKFICMYNYLYVLYMCTCTLVVVYVCMYAMVATKSLQHKNASDYNVLMMV